MTKEMHGSWLRWTSQQLKLIRSDTFHQSCCNGRIFTIRELRNTKKCISFPNFLTQIMFEGRRGSNEESDVAIDDVKLYHGRCSGKKLAHSTAKLMKALGCVT